MTEPTTHNPINPGARVVPALPRMGEFGLKSIWADGDSTGRLARGAIVKQLLGTAWRSFVLAPISSLLTMTTIAVSLLLLGGLILVFQNLSHLVASTQEEITLTLFLKNDQLPARARRGSEMPLSVNTLAAELDRKPEVRSVRYRSPGEALTEFRKSLGADGAILDDLDSDNPLPASLEVHFEPKFSAPQVYDRIAEEYRRNPLIDYVHYSSGVVGQLGAILATLQIGGGVVIFLMLLITGFIMANTIKLALYAHRQEIEIMRLVGATQLYVQAPFLIEGFVQGLLGGVAGVCGVYVLYGMMARFIARTQFLGEVVGTLQFLSVSAIVLIICCGMFVGVAGSHFALRRFKA